jgi:transposase
VHEPADDGACTCPACGGGIAKLGEDVTKVLDYVPGRFQVIRHVRPKYACKACDEITQAPAPAMPTPRGRATPATLAHLLVSKYCDHLPLYRQSEIYARDGVDLDRSTLCSPASVSRVERLLRSNRRTFSCPSRSWIWRLSGDCSIPRRAPARAK